MLSWKVILSQTDNGLRVGPDQYGDGMHVLEDTGTEDTHEAERRVAAWSAQIGVRQFDSDRDTFLG